MHQEILYQNCPLCNQGPVSLDPQLDQYQCRDCGLTLQEKSVWGLFHKGHWGVVKLGGDNFALATAALKNASLPADRLKVVLGNVYSDEALASIAAGSLDTIRPVSTVLAQIILEQVKETCYVQINGVRMGQGQPLTGSGGYQPIGNVPRQGLQWVSEGNLFGTTRHLVLPSDKFTFIRLDRKLAAVQAFTDGVAVQRKGEDFATYFVGCFSHEAALMAAFVQGKIPSA